MQDPVGSHGRRQIVSFAGACVSSGSASPHRSSASRMMMEMLTVHRFVHFLYTNDPMCPARSI